MLDSFVSNLVRWLSVKNKQPVGRRERPKLRLTVEVLEVRLTPALTYVPGTTGFPYTSIVKLFMTFPNGKLYHGSGAMVDSFHVLTAGHNVYSKGDGGWAKSIRVVPEMDGYSKASTATGRFGFAMTTYMRTFTSWVNWNNSRPNGGTATNVRDMALLTLDRKIGNSTGWMAFGYDNNNARFARGKIFNTAGYPADSDFGYSGKYMYRSAGPLNGVSSDQQAITYIQRNITTYGGQSGSPVWEYVSSSGKRTIFGVVAGGGNSSNSVNFATRITQTIFNSLVSWRKSDSAPLRGTTQTAIGIAFKTDLGVGSAASVGEALHGSLPVDDVASPLLQGAERAASAAAPGANANGTPEVTVNRYYVFAGAAASINTGTGGPGSQAAIQVSATQSSLAAKLGRSSLLETHVRLAGGETSPYGYAAVIELPRASLTPVNPARGTAAWDKAAVAPIRPMELLREPMSSAWDGGDLLLDEEPAASSTPGAIVPALLFDSTDRDTTGVESMAALALVLCGLPGQIDRHASHEARQRMPLVPMTGKN